jgi:hypothetical protein
LLLGERIILVLFNNGAVCFHDRVETFFAEFKDFVGIAIVLIIEKDSSIPTSLVAVLNDKVAIGPSLKLFVVVWIVLIADLLVSSMKVFHVVLIDIAWSNVRTYTCKEGNVQ